MVLVVVAVAGYVAAFLLWWSPGESLCARCGTEFPRWRSRDYCPACRVILNEEWRETNRCERCAATRR